MNKTGKIKGSCMIGVLSIAVCTAGCSDLEQHLEEDSSAQVQSAATLAEVPEYSGDPYVEINDNQPEFEDYELTRRPLRNTASLTNWGAAVRRKPVWARRPCPQKSAVISAP